MTNDDLRNIDVALAQLRKQPLRPAMNFMVTYCIKTLTPAFEALNDSERTIAKEFLDVDERGLARRDEAYNLKLLEGKTMGEYEKALEELFKLEVEPPLPKFKFKLTDFENSGVNVSPDVTIKLGPLVNLDGLEEYIARLQEKQGTNGGPPIRGPAL